MIQNVWRWIAGRQNEKCSDHYGNPIVKVCCNDFCQYDRYICSNPQCAEKHRGHTLMDYEQFKSKMSQVEKQIKYRQQIEDSISEYYGNLIKYMTDIFEKQQKVLLEYVDKNFLGKTYGEIYQRFLEGKDYYSLLPNLQVSTGMELSEAIRKRIKEKEKKIPTLFKDFISSNQILLDQSIFPNNEKVREIINMSKVDKIKALLPFKCELVLKFQASKNRFMTRKLYESGIRGPIILIAESYKNKQFGGFSPKMFPKEEKYEQDYRCKSFLFSLDHRVILPLKEEFKKYSIKGGSNLWFGRGDLTISDECQKANISWAQIGRAYQLPHGIHGPTNQWLGGSLYFRVIEYEIYEVEIQYQK